ncbi:preprotein translocase subunit SecE [Anaerolineales bacterium HSG6]|nr:preprotein translocase subunit SecE [Anaerolineales bacterium HSG6]MDM8532052.1 preprotein translocase subunit SecE [Anaerolineales bacterium HSG25]
MAKSKSSATTTTTTTKEENAVVKYYKETRAELRKVTWPTREEARTLTLVITAVTIAMAIFLGVFDYIFQVVVRGIISGDLIMVGAGVVLFAAGVAVFYFNAQEE